ncbi:hypothetical protein [Methylosinus sp. Sm6]|uniref:hypothetical protein n=1 Tax=Methylosinus sp. Sm6 TaxID=2866948 RepID=UPI001C997981|nr:hypothetical protein [Methylosinus sp. Sm6]MBY6240969.1 hypothetical protein [Methylosinus sp. Sm6]
MGSAKADLPRADLSAAKIGTGRYGFRIPLVLGAPVDELNVLKARVVGAPDELPSIAILTSEELSRFSMVELPLDEFPVVRHSARDAGGSRRVQFDAGAFNEFRRRFLLV